MSDTPSHWAMQVAVPFVTEQSLGEWGDEIIEADATKLALLLDRVVAEKDAEIGRLKGLLKESGECIDKLADQQAMADDIYQLTRRRIDAALAGRD